MTATNTVGLIVYLNTAIKHSTVHHFVDDTYASYK